MSQTAHLDMRFEQCLLPKTEYKQVLTVICRCCECAMQIFCKERTRTGLFPEEDTVAFIVSAAG